MPVTFNFPTTTLPIGPTTFGPVAISNNDSSLTLSIDRTVAGGLNELTLSSILRMEAQVSTDGGTSWHAIDAGQDGSQAFWETTGSPITYTDRQGVVHIYPASLATWPLFPGKGRTIKAIATVSGPSAIVIAGSIVTT